jgi:hypothetical protein
MAKFTPTQGRYLSFIQSYIERHGRPPAEAEIAAAMCVSPPSVNQMVKMLEKKGLILRHPGQPRALEILVPVNEIPPWGNRKPARISASSRQPPPNPALHPPAKLYVLSVFLSSGPFGKKFSNKVVQRVIEIRGDQTLEQFHQAIFDAFDRWDDHLYEFQFGKRPFDPAGPNIGIEGSPSMATGKLLPTQRRDARTTRLDDLKLNQQSVFGYWFDFGDNWYHQIQVDRIEQAIPTVTYPRISKRVGKSPPQYQEEDDE